MPNEILVPLILASLATPVGFGAPVGYVFWHVNRTNIGSGQDEAA